MQTRRLGTTSEGVKPAGMFRNKAVYSTKCRDVLEVLSAADRFIT